MKNFARPLLALMLVLSMGLGSVALAACSSASSSDGSASSASSDSSDSADDQADCYGDDLPAVNNSK